jgi:hypothetical protein
LVANGIVPKKKKDIEHQAWKIFNFQLSIYNQSSIN